MGNWGLLWLGIWHVVRDKSSDQAMGWILGGPSREDQKEVVSEVGWKLRRMSYSQLKKAFEWGKSDHLGESKLGPEDFGRVVKVKTWLEWVQERMEGVKLDTVCLFNSFKELSCKEKERNRAVARKTSRVKRRFLKMGVLECWWRKFKRQRKTDDVR